MAHTLSATWTDDCQGKKDYDGDILSISTRYWPGPAGGGTMAFDTGTGEVSTIPYGPKPSAKSSLILRYWHEKGYEDYETLIEREFEGDTFEDVKAQVEAWAQEQMDEAAGLLRRSFAV